MSATWAVLLVAPFVGSFLGVLVQRIPAGRDFAHGRSSCDSCGTVLAARDLVPLASYFANRGQCRHCGAPIGRFHLAIELAALAIAAIAAGFDTGDRLVFGCVLGWGLLAASWIDARCMELPDGIILPLILAGLGASWWLDPESAPSHALGVLAGYAAFRAVAAIYRRFRGRDGLGEGDVRLLALAGAWLGWRPLPWVVCGGAIAALVFVAVATLFGRRFGATSMVPFGPFLAVAIWMLWLMDAGGIAYFP